jgi:hypothetical protein
MKQWEDNLLISESIANSYETYGLATRIMPFGNCIFDTDINILN